MAKNEPKLIMGIDEAGRGALIGPLVVAGVVISKEDESKLKRHGVKDSKMLKPKKREELAEVIEEVAKSVIVLRVQPCKIDTLRSEGINLDRIEAIKMAEIIGMGEAEKIYVDSLTHNPKKFQNVLLEYLQNKELNLVVENYADETYTVVSAASIIAKVERDKAVQEIKDKVNFDFGVGYPHDERTIQFVEKLIRENRGKELPPFIRQSWVTIQILKENSLQRKLKEFLGLKLKEEEKIDYED